MLTNPQISIYNSTKERNLFMAGVGSGKSHVGGIISVKYITKFPRAIGFIGANTYGQLSKSTLKRVFDVWGSFGMVNGIHYVVDKIPPESWMKYHSRMKTYSNTISFNNGALIFTASLDSYKTIDGVELGWAILDETKDTKEQAVKEVIVARLRQAGLGLNANNQIVDFIDKTKVRSFNPLYILTSPAKVDWINEWFEMDEYYDEIIESIFSKTTYYHKETKRKCTVISSTYHNEANLPEGYIENMIDDYKGNDHLVDMLIYGSPVAKSGGEFYHQFKRSEHVSTTIYDKERPIHSSFDFNVVPYMYSLVGQIKLVNGIFEVDIHKEFVMTAPRNNSEDTAAAVYGWYYNHKTGCFVYGDATGKNRSTMNKAFKHNFEIIEDQLRPMLFTDFDRVMRSNPPLVKRRDFMNKMFANGLPIKLRIDPSCSKLILDLEFIKENPEGGKLKQHEKDALTGETYEKYGHASDTLDYFICSAFEMYFHPR